MPTGNNKLALIRSHLKEKKTAIMRLLPEHISEKKFVFIVDNALVQTPSLQNCTPESIVRCVIQAARLGLELNGPTKECYMIPFKSVATLVMGYDGLLKLAYNAGTLERIDVIPVHKDDHFRVVRGTDNPRIEHEEVWKNGHDISNVDNIVAYYAVLTMKNGDTTFFTMSPGEVQKVKNASPSARAKESPWQQWPEKMALKTVLKNALRFVPKSPDLQTAITIDSVGESGGLTTKIQVGDDDVIEGEYKDITHEIAQTAQAQNERLKQKIGADAPPAKKQKPKAETPPDPEPPADIVGGDDGFDLENPTAPKTPEKFADMDRHELEMAISEQAAKVGDAEYKKCIKAVGASSIDALDDDGLAILLGRLVDCKK